MVNKHFRVGITVDDLLHVEPYVCLAHPCNYVDAVEYVMRKAKHQHPDSDVEFLFVEERDGEPPMYSMPLDPEDRTWYYDDCGTKRRKSDDSIV